MIIAINTKPIEKYINNNKHIQTKIKQKIIKYKKKTQYISEEH
jgi:hypothetical protein